MTSSLRLASSQQMETFRLVENYIRDRIRLLSFYTVSNIVTISNDVGLCFRFGQISNGSKFARFSIKKGVKIIG